MEQEKIACGIWRLIQSSVRDYMLYHGRKPFALVLHPAHMAEFCSEIEVDDDPLDGMVILQSADYARSVLLNEHNRVTDL